jgi:hypothetical protein
MEGRETAFDWISRATASRAEAHRVQLSEGGKWGNERGPTERRPPAPAAASERRREVAEGDRERPPPLAGISPSFGAQAQRPARRSSRVHFERRREVEKLKRLHRAKVITAPAAASERRREVAEGDRERAARWRN